MCRRPAHNDPLLDGNKRAAWAALVVFIDLNNGRWATDPPDVADAEQTMLSVASGDLDKDALAAWLRERVAFE